jgi:hypothetical protein
MSFYATCGTRVNVIIETGYQRDFTNVRTMTLKDLYHIQQKKIYAACPVWHISSSQPEWTFTADMFEVLVVRVGTYGTKPYKLRMAYNEIDDTAKEEYPAFLGELSRHIMHPHMFMKMTKDLKPGDQVYRPLKTKVAGVNQMANTIDEIIEISHDKRGPDDMFSNGKWGYGLSLLQGWPKDLKNDIPCYIANGYWVPFVRYPGDTGGKAQR